MRKENILASIEIMKRAEAAGSLDMTRWQSTPDNSYKGVPALTEQALHLCGNKACLAGHIAISPEFKADGGSPVRWGSPAYLSKDGLVVDTEQYAIGRWLGVDDDLAELLIYSVGGHIGRNDHPHPVYGTVWKDVQPRHVISALKELMKIGEVAFYSKYAPSLPPSCDAFYSF